MAFCRNCGAQLADTAAFCPNCGTKKELEAPVGQNHNAQQPKTQYPVTQQPKTQYPETQYPQNQTQYPKTQQQSRNTAPASMPLTVEEAPKKKKKTGLIIAIIAAVLIVAAVACAVFFLFGNKKEADGDTSVSKENKTETVEVEAYKEAVAQEGKEAAQQATLNPGSGTGATGNDVVEKDDEDPETTLPGNSGTEQYEAMANGEKPYEGQTLVVWTGYEQGTAILEVADAWIARFEELSGADIQVVHRGRDLQTMLYPSLDAGEEIDVFQVGSCIQLGLQKDHALDLADYIADSDIADRAYPVLMKQILDYGDGNYYAIPTMPSMNAWWYNKDIFDAAGITEVPETIEEFEAACDAIVKAGYYPMAVDSAYAAGTVGPLVSRMVGEDIVAELTKNGGFAENEDFVAACQKIIDWRNKGYFEPNAPGVWPESQSRIGLMQDTAMVYTGAWVSEEVEAVCGEKLNWGSFPYPVDPNSKNGTEGVSVSCTCVMINKDCEVSDLAWDYMYFMYTAEANKAISDVSGYPVGDRTMDPLPKFEGTQDAMETAEDYVDGTGGLYANIDIKVSVTEICTNLLSGYYTTGLEAARAFDALLK